MDWAVGGRAGGKEDSEKGHGKRRLRGSSTDLPHGREGWLFLTRGGYWKLSLDLDVLCVLTL